MKVIIRCMVNWLISKGTVLAEDRDLYEYAGYSLFITVLPILLTMIIGGMQRQFFESILIIIPFMCMRKYSGGFHMKYAWMCMIFSCSILYLCVYVIAHIKYSIYVSICLICAAISLMIFSPIDSNNKQLEEYEIFRYKKTTIIMAIFFMILHIILLLIGRKSYAICIAEGTILTAVLQLPCLVKRMLNKIKRAYE